ncbi:hypothetical protein CWI36_0310p0010 [Hamiltosporidium magnivora]|uniref:Uncharacterized protein n=1 Tax=Hamiltosporidium magnivora TaxID=148818 RepID=A0A4Q9LGJ5_9MICR|nr:hypothetical protein CWI36_0310p0010 [Hamiltosporidium magnivora]
MHFCSFVKGLAESFDVVHILRYDKHIREFLKYIDHTSVFRLGFYLLFENIRLH